MVQARAKTPRYVLKEDANPIGPSVAPAQSGANDVVLFGFSDKPEYDRFQKASSVRLMPYPLVKGFLKNQIELPSDARKLFVLDADSPKQAIYHAATFQAVLESFENGTEAVEVSHRLTMETASSDYRVETLAAEIDAAAATLV